MSSTALACSSDSLVRKTFQTSVEFAVRTSGIHRNMNKSTAP
jgi:hypothetical protein